ncbi:HAD hydrolase family protein [Salmonella enterica]|nr:HAD hydrolase family protein [Salmonella enterica]
MLLITDLDGTLLTSQKTISPRTRQALIAFRQNGGLLAACSARPVSQWYACYASNRLIGCLAGAPVLTADACWRWRGRALFMLPR